MQQTESTYWTTYTGAEQVPPTLPPPTVWRNGLCPRGLALHHPAGGHLLSYATGGCPANTGHNWTRQEMEEAVTLDPYVSAMDPGAIKQLASKVVEKVAANR